MTEKRHQDFCSRRVCLISKRIDGQFKMPCDLSFYVSWFSILCTHFIHQNCSNKHARALPGHSSDPQHVGGTTIFQSPSLFSKPKYRARESRFGNAIRGELWERNAVSLNNKSVISGLFFLPVPFRIYSLWFQTFLNAKGP